MKGVLVILDGMGDLPCKQLDEKTPLEAANMPHLDFLATRGEMGYMYVVKPGFVPESHEAILSLFGNDLMNNTRGQLEARGTDIKLVRGDLAFRVNFATIDNPKDGNIIDRRVGRTLTTVEAEILAKALNKIVLPCEFVFKPTVQHRGVFVLRGGFSDNITGNDRAYTQGGEGQRNKIGMFKAADEEDNTQYTVNILKEFAEKAFEVLDKHPVNETRRKRGLLPANYLLMRGGGVEPPKLKIYRKWMCVAYMPLEIGFSRVSGMTVFSFDYPKLKSMDSYENLQEGLEKACDFAISNLKKKFKDFDYAYIHIKETDLPGHDNKPLVKKAMFEYIDKTLFKFLAEFAPPNKIKVAVTGDHSTPCRLKSHSDDPVPVLLYNVSPPKKPGFFSTIFRRNQNLNAEKVTEKKGEKFCEKNARLGSLGRIDGKGFLEKIGFLK